MSWVPDRNDRDYEDRKGHVDPPDRNPTPVREQQRDDRQERERDQRK